MRHLVLASACLISVSAFAMRAPKGEYIALSCSSIGAKTDFRVRLMDHAKTGEMKIVVVREDCSKKVYQPVRREIGRGGSVTYSAPATGGRLALITDSTVNPRSGVANATLVASTIERVTKTELSCLPVKY